MCLLAGRRGERDHREVRYSIGRVLDEPGDAVVPFDALGIEHNARGRDRRSRPCSCACYPAAAERVQHIDLGLVAAAAAVAGAALCRSARVM